MSLNLALATLPLVGLYARWCSLTKHTPSHTPAWDACVYAAFVDPHQGTPGFFIDTRGDYRAELAVRADQLQAAGDPRGEWLAIWLMPSSEYRDHAIVDSAPALAEHVARLIAEHERRARRTKTLPRKGPWSIEPNSTLMLRVDDGPDQVVTFRGLDFADTRQVVPLELAVTINEQLTGAHAEHVGYSVEITSYTYNGKVEIVGGSAALSFGLYRLAAKTFTLGALWHEDDWVDRMLRGNSFSTAIVDDAMHRTQRHGMSAPYIDIRSRPPSVHDEVAVSPVYDAAVARMREQFAAYATRRAPVSAEVLQAITEPSESRDP